ncbi:MAG: RpiB/LacA/LacB family sugar-phosphate isomerase [Actinomycetota bacterium]|nr:RpiB/LacA/LacB family sugar-phosphate isomerase [Actinomycetota bacterium]
MKIAIGCDVNANDRMQDLVQVLEQENIEHKVFEVDGDYPDVAAEVTKAVQDGTYDRGILVCGTGLGMAICANKFKGIRAAVCHDLYSAQRSILSNDCQVLAMGSFIVGTKLAQEILKVWLSIERTGGTVSKVKKIEQLEQ